MAYSPKALDSLFGATVATYDSNGVHVAALRSRKGEGQWDFKGNDFLLEAKVMTGMLDAKTGKYYLVFNTVAGCEGKDGLFEIAVKEKNGEGKFAPNKEKSSEQQLLWNKGYNTVALLTEGIDNFSILAKVLFEMQAIVKAPKALTAKYVLDAEVKTDLEAALCEHLSDFIANGKPKAGNPILERVKVIADNGILVLPILDAAQLPKREIKDDYGEVEEVVTECFPYDGELPFWSSIGVVLPAMPEKNGNGGKSWGNSGGSVDPKAALEARQAFVIKAFNDAQLCTNAVTLKDVFDGCDGKDGKAYLEFVCSVMGK